MRISSGGQGDGGIDTAISNYLRATYNDILSGELRENVSARPKHLRYDAAVNGKVRLDTQLDWLLELKCIQARTAVFK